MILHQEKRPFVGKKSLLIMISLHYVIPPQVAVLATGRVKTQPAMHNKQLVTHQLLPLSLSFDHRIITGGEAARFLKCLIDALEAN